MRVVLVIVILSLLMMSPGPISSDLAEPRSIQNQKTIFNETSDSHVEYQELNTIWPINRTTWDNELNLTSTFGPRQKASDNYRYDFHRGIDITAAYGTPVYAIDHGVVRLISINSTHEKRDDGTIDDIYTSSVIQLKHNNTVFNQAQGANFYYSNYLHINTSRVEVTANETVNKGQLLGYIGNDPNSNFAHLHFEIRNGGLSRNYATHPLTFLPNTNGEFPQVEMLDQTWMINSSALGFEVSVSDQELDFTQFSLSGSLNENSINTTYDMVLINNDHPNWQSLDSPVISIDGIRLSVYPWQYSNFIDHAKYNVTINFSSMLSQNLSTYDLELRVADAFQSGTALYLNQSVASKTSTSHTSPTYSEGTADPLRQIITNPAVQVILVVVVALVLIFRYKEYRTGNIE